MRTLRGFSLMELMITLVIAAILATVAIPSYRSYVIRSHRAAAKAVMMDVAGRQHQFLLTTRSYADTAALTANGYAMPPDVQGRYTLAVTADNAGTPPTFLITMTPIGAQVSDGALTLDSAGNRLPAAKWER